MIRNNSEIKKYIWSDFSPLILMIIPFILGLILCYQLLTFQSWNKYDRIADPFIVLYILSVWVFGSYKTGSTFIEESLNKTLDNIRLSSMTPWQLL